MNAIVARAPSVGESPITTRRAMCSKRSRVHPTYTAKYHLATRTECDAACVFEARLGGNLLNRMWEMARRRSVAIVA